MFLSRTPEMVSAEDALPGRDAPLPTPPPHEVLGTPPTPPWPEGHEEVWFAMGCFWGAERIFWRLDGVWTTAAGYAGGFTPNPTYRETCTGATGHAEAVLVVHDPAAVSFERLLAAFWENHDPTQRNRQGNDVGTQYRSGIYTTTPTQLRHALASRERYQAALSAAGHGEITTEILPLADTGAGRGYLAETFHQQYLHKHPNGYCNHGFCQVAYEPADHGHEAPARISLPEA
jgi:peptide-methionine (S)-S-oxide reductase